MNLIWCLLAFTQAFASPAPLSFSARIQNEALAEEAIDLLHCLSERKGIPWELGTENSPAPSVRLVEKNGALEGEYRGEEKKEFRLERNGWRAACDQLAPGAAPSAPVASSGPFLPTEEPAPAPGHANKTWLVAGAAVAVLAGGFILWRANRPDHRSLRME